MRKSESPRTRRHRIRSMSSSSACHSFLSRVRSRRCVGAVVAIILSTGSTAHADDSITLAEALARALERSPELRPYDPGRRALEAERLQAGLLPNPAISVELENFAGSGEVTGTKALETTLALSQLVELGGKRSRRVGVVEGELGTFDAEYAVARLDVLAETAIRVTDVAEAQAQVELADHAIELVERTRTAVERRVRAGATSTAERNRTEIALIRARLDAQRARSELETKRASLAAMWGDTSPDFAQVVGDLAQIPDLVEFAPLAEKLMNSPELLKFAAERRLRESELALARAKRVPDFVISAGPRFLNESDDTALVAGLSLPLPVFDRNQGEIAATKGRVARAVALRDAALIRTRQVLFGLYLAAQQARAQAAALTTDAIPQAEEALTLTQRGFENGRFSFLELADVQRQALELRRQVITEQADAHRLDAELERLTGEPFVSAGTALPAAPSPGDRP